MAWKKQLKLNIDNTVPAPGNLSILLACVIISRAIRENKRVHYFNSVNSCCLSKTKNRQLSWWPSALPLETVLLLARRHFSHLNEIFKWFKKEN